MKKKNFESEGDIVQQKKCLIVLNSDGEEIY